MTASITHTTHPPGPAASDAPQWEGCTFGAIVLAAFALYGIGSAIADQPIGLTLVVLNSTAVTAAGWIGFRLVRSVDRSVGLSYLVARLAEATLLAGGMLRAELADVGGADTTGYLVGMIALSIGSVPFFKTLRRHRLIPQSLATCGAYGYATLATGALLELTTGRPLTVIFAEPGGLFELALGLRMIWLGFDNRTTFGASSVSR